MRVSIGQIYIVPGATFPFSHHMQLWLGEKLSSACNEPGEFQKRHGADFELMVRVSAKKGTSENEIKGPTVFRKTRDVEYTLFLPFDTIAGSAGGCFVAAEFLLDGLLSVFQRAGLGTSKLNEQKSSLVAHICSEPSMLSKPWPY
jgi:hypothetical protein